MEGVYGSIGDHWKGLGVGTTSKCFWNWREIRVGGTLKVLEVRVGETLRHLQSEKEVVP